MKVRLVSKTVVEPEYLEELADTYGDLKGLANSEALMAYVARVSSPNQANPEYARLLQYCLRHGHWSVFEHVSCTFEIETSRAIAAQILRHRSFCFQEFSQRYSKANMGIEIYEARSQDNKNRQNSIDNMSKTDKEWFREAQEHIENVSFSYYSEALDRGVAKEQARFLLPLNTKTKLYMTGNLRNWIHYVQLRGANGTQREHMLIAKEIETVMAKKFPTVFKALND